MSCIFGQNDKFILPDEAVRRAYAWHTTEGACAKNSQVKELIADGTLESCRGSAEEAIPDPPGESFRFTNRARQTWRALFFALYQTERRMA